MTTPERPFVPWIEMETFCACLRRRCRHKRRDEARNVAQQADRETIEALTDGDVVWLREMGWTR